MNFVRIDPPGTFCTQEALRDALKGCEAGTFLDVGCGGGNLSKLLCDTGFSGAGIDFSTRAICPRISPRSTSPSASW
jgi:2-polyprenyl-3-methyl-5-hydroxy-6-metoxy-1,4-benzoquinol methylase